MMDEGTLGASHIDPLMRIKFSVEEDGCPEGELQIRMPTYTPLERVKLARDVIFRAILAGQVKSKASLLLLGGQVREEVRRLNAKDGLRDARTRKGADREAARARAKEERDRRPLRSQTEDRRQKGQRV